MNRLTEYYLDDKRPFGTIWDEFASMPALTIPVTGFVGAVVGALPIGLTHELNAPNTSSTADAIENLSYRDNYIEHLLHSGNVNNAATNNYLTSELAVDKVQMKALTTALTTERKQVQAYNHADREMDIHMGIGASIGVLVMGAAIVGRNVINNRLKSSRNKEYQASLLAKANN